MSRLRMSRDAAIAAIALIAQSAICAAVTGKPNMMSGDVTRAELKMEVKQVFARADVNKDGFMSRSEFAARMGVVLNRAPPGTAGAPTKEQAQKILDAANAAFNAVDVNHDGKLSLTETEARPLAAFDMMDTNHDGVLTMAEKIAAHEPKGPDGEPLAARKFAPGR